MQAHCLSHWFDTSCSFYVTVPYSHRLCLCETSRCNKNRKRAKWFGGNRGPQSDFGPLPVFKSHTGSKRTLHALLARFFLSPWHWVSTFNLCCRSRRLHKATILFFSVAPRLVRPRITLSLSCFLIDSLHLLLLNRAV